MRAVPSAPGAYPFAALCNKPSGSPVASKWSAHICRRYIGGIRSNIGSLSMPLRVSPGPLGIFAGSNTWYRKKTHSAMAPTAKIRMGLAMAMMMIEVSCALLSRGKVTRHLPLQFGFPLNREVYQGLAAFCWSLRQKQ
jgi:hypothetical protein